MGSICDAKMGPSWDQNRSKNRPQTARPPQEAPRGAQERPKDPKRRPRAPQEAPKRPQEAPKRHPRAPKRHPRAPKGSQEQQKGTQEHPNGNKCFKVLTTLARFPFLLRQVFLEGLFRTFFRRFFMLLFCPVLGAILAPFWVPKSTQVGPSSVQDGS